MVGGHYSTVHMHAGALSIVACFVEATLDMHAGFMNSCAPSFEATVPMKTARLLALLCFTEEEMMSFRLMAKRVEEEPDRVVRGERTRGP